MKRLSKNRILSLFLALTILFTAMPFNNVVANEIENGNENYSTNIGAVGEFVASSVLLASSPAGEGASDVRNGVDPTKLPAKIVITNYYYNEYAESEDTRLWYQIDAAPGYEWPVEYADYHWTYGYAIKINDPNGITVVFDADGNNVNELEIPLYDKVLLSADSSLQGAVEYQWQICYDTKNDLWVDIYGENSAEIEITCGMIATLLDENNSIKVRCESVSASKSNTSAEIVVNVIVINDSDEETPITPSLNIQIDGKDVTSADFYYDYDTELKLNAVVSGVDAPVFKWDICTSLTNDTWLTLESTTDELLVDFWTCYGRWIDASYAIVRVCVEGTDLSTTLTLKRVDEVSNEGVNTEEYRLAAYSLRENTTYNVMATSDELVSESVNVTVKFVYGSNGETVAADQVYNIQKNGSVTNTITLPVIEGYDAYFGDDTTTILKSYSINLTNVTEDTVITFKYWPAKVNYTVIYYWQNAGDDKYTEHYRYTNSDFTGNIAKVDNLVFDGFYQLLYEDVPIASDGSTVIEVYYDRLYYKMTFDLDGGYGVQPIYARYGTEIDVSNPARAGYSFVGWDNIMDGTGDGIADTLPLTIPAYHSAYKAVWKATDNAKVTIVYWGENANDENYSYLESQELYVKPGTELTFGIDQLVCTLSEHTHGDGSCTYKCNLEAHTHSLEQNCYELICTKESHIHTELGCELNCTHDSHTINCYSAGNYSLIVTEEPTEPYTHIGNGIYTYTTVEDGLFGSTYEQTHYYLKIGEQWYCAGIKSDWYTNHIDYVKISLSCSHSHTDACYTCGEDEVNHVHNIANGCYALICTATDHTHNANCYSCIQHTHNDDCYLKTTNMDSDLWTYVQSDTVTVAADGSTVMNVYYDRTTFTITFHYNRSNGNYQSTSTITDKWGADIATRFLDVNTTAKGNLWSESTSGDSPWTSYLQIMPQRNIDYYCKHTSTNAQSAKYYIQELDGTYSLEYTVNAYYSNGTLTISKEDFYEMEGFTYSHGTDGDGKTMPSPGSYGDFHGAKFYYTRNSFVLDFNNGEGVVKSESVLYEQALSSYDFTPEAPSFYEPGSVKFAGWYLNPECTGEQYVLSEHIMPASNLILYAKWVPVTHTVRFYLDETLERTDDNVYSATVDGVTITYKYEVPHGSAVQNPYTPPNDPTKGQYIFVGWFYIDSYGHEQMWDFENTTVAGDTDIYAKWSSNILVEYTVRFVYKHGDSEIEIAAPITGSALGGNSKTFEAKGNNQLYAGYQEGYFSTTQSHTIVMDLDNPENNTYTFYYTKENAVPYTVYYVTNTQNDEGTLDSVILNGKTYYIVADTKQVVDNKKAIVTETYKKVAGYLPNTYQQTLIINPTEDAQNIIIFEYDKDEKNGMYVVHYWTENLNGTYSEHSIFEGRGEKGSTVTATIKDIENFTYDESVSGTVISGTISIESVLELHVYYTRNSYPYKVQYLEQGTNKELANEKITTAQLWEKIVMEEAIKIENYTLVGDSEISIQIRKDTTNPTVNIITFYYTENRVTINYVVAGGTGSVDPGNESVKILSGVANGSTAVAENGYRFVGWYSDSTCTNFLTKQSKFIPTKEDGEKWVDGTTFYAKFEPDNTSLTIKKLYPESADYSIDENQTFIFTVKGVQETNTAGIDLTVTIHGNGAITITDLPIGNYVVTEQTDWSWRYDLTEWSFTTDGDNDKNVSSNGVNGATITLGATGNDITFSNERTKIYWLDGDSYKVNIFRKKEDKEGGNVNV